MIHQYPFQSCYFSSQDGRLHYVDTGRGPNVTLLHGNPTWSYYFRHLIGELSPDFRVIAPDHLGCGLSAKPAKPQYLLSDHIDNLIGLLDYLEIEKTSLVVHDWGGAIGMGFATRYVERIEKVVILNTAAFRSSRIPLRIRICRWPLVGRLIVCGLNGFAWPATYMAVRKNMNSAVRNGYLLPYDSWSNRRGIYNFVKDIPLSAHHPSYQALVDIESKLKAISRADIPVAIYWGGKDFCFTDHFFAEWCKRFPQATSHYFSDAGHYVLEDEHGTIEPLIHSFLLKPR